MPKAIKKSDVANMKDIYALLQVSWQTIYKWRENLVSTHEGSLKRNFIHKAGCLFSLSPDQEEELANKAGLSLCESRFRADHFPRVQKIASNLNFAVHIKSLLKQYPGKQSNLYMAASMTDRMFRYIKSGQYLKKESILTLLIVMDLELPDIQIALKKAGFILSNSLLVDAIITWVLNNDARNLKGEERLWCVNNMLEALSLPLLIKEPKE